jgi:ABC-type polar amino acid transport system ATPase subunit
LRADRVLRKKAASKRERATSLAVTHEMTFAAGGQAERPFTNDGVAATIG